MEFVSYLDYTIYRYNLIYRFLISSSSLTLYGIIFIASIITLEWYNCLMYIKDTIPFSDNCLIMCIIPLSGIAITQVQFIGYLRAIRCRLTALNAILRKKNLNSISDHIFYLNEFSVSSNPINKYEPRQKAINLRNQLFYQSEPSKEILVLEQLNHIEIIIRNLKRLKHLINSVYQFQMLFILTIKFITLTTLLYFCCMKLFR